MAEIGSHPVNTTAHSYFS